MSRDTLAVKAIWQVVLAAVPDDPDLAALLTNRAYTRGIPLNELRGWNRDALILRIFNVPPAHVNNELEAIAQTVAILGEGIKITRELAQAAQTATGLGR